MLSYIHNLAASGYWFEKALREALSDWQTTRFASPPLVVDFGCGKKPFQKFFKNFECRYSGLDVYDGACVDIVYDGTTIPLETDSVDLVFSVSVFEHVAALDRSLQEIARILKPGGRLIAVVPFINHVHGSPFDYHRPTRMSWELKLQQAFGSATQINVSPVDARIVCIGNIVTAQINFILFDLARWLLLRRQTGAVKQLAAGAASPESGSKGLTVFYFLLKLNPLNFLIGLCCWLLAFIPIARRSEGEITSGYCMVLQTADTE